MLSHLVDDYKGHLKGTILKKNCILNIYPKAKHDLTGIQILLVTFSRIKQLGLRITIRTSHVGP